MKETIKEAKPEEVAEQKKTIQKTEAEKRLEDETELSAKKAELKRNTEITKGYTDPMRGQILPMDKAIERTIKIIEMVEIEIKYGQMESANRNYRFQSDQRWNQLNRELNFIPRLEQAQTNLKKLEEQKNQMAKVEPQLKKRINELEKKLKKEVTKFEEEE